MKLIFDEEGFYAESRINTTIPKEKLIEKLQNVRQKQKLYREIDNIEDVLYHHILRMAKSSAYREELHIIEVRLQAPKYIKPIAEVLHLLIPYHKSIIFSSGQKYLLFEDSPDSDISQYNYTEWKYLEELLFADSEYSMTVPDVPDEDTFSVASIQSEIWDFFTEQRTIYSYACLRRIIDLFKIREGRDGKQLLKAAINELVGFDQVEYYNDNPFVEITYADQQYIKRNPHLSSFSTLEDFRFGIDRQFEPLSEDELTTPGEVAELLEEALRVSVMGVAFSEDSFEDDEWTDNDTYDEYETRKNHGSNDFESEYYDSMVREYNSNRPARSYAPRYDEEEDNGYGSYDDNDDEADYDQ